MEPTEWSLLSVWLWYHYVGVLVVIMDFASLPRRKYLMAHVDGTWRLLLFLPESLIWLWLRNRPFGRWLRGLPSLEEEAATVEWIARNREVPLFSPFNDKARKVLGWEAVSNG